MNKYIYTYTTAYIYMYVCVFLWLLEDMTLQHLTSSVFVSQNIIIYLFRHLDYYSISNDAMNIFKDLAFSLKLFS